MRPRARLYQLAAQAWERIQKLSHDPVESIVRAMVEAEKGEARIIPPELDDLGPAQRRAAILLWSAEGEVTRGEMAQALGCTGERAYRTLRLLMAHGVASHGADRGRYRFQLGPSRILNRGAPSVQSMLRPLALVRQRGRLTPVELSRLTACARRTANRRLLSLLAAGLVQQPERGVYVPVTTPDAMRVA